MSRLVLNPAFDIGQIVYLKTDMYQYERYVTGLCIGVGGVIEYRLSFETIESYHYEFEISSSRDVVKTL